MKKLKRLLSVVLALTMILSLAAVAFAYEIDVYPATGAELNNGETYSAYKIFDVTVNTSTTPYSYSYSIDSSNPFYNTIDNLTAWFTLELQNGSSTVYTVSPTDDLSALSELPTEVLEALAAVDLTGVSADGTGTYSETSGYAAITLTDPGYYYVTTSIGSAVLVDTYSEALDVYDKNDTPSVDKEVYNAEGTPSDTGNYDYDSSDWDENSYAQIGDTVYFQTTISNIADITKLTLHDGLEDGLTLDSSSITVYFVADGSDPTAVTLNTDVTNSCTISTTSQTHSTPSFECDFEVKLDDVLSTCASSITDNSIIVVTYSATVNNDAEIYTDSNDNATYISYGDASYSEVATTKTYVYKLTVYKYTGTDPLAGVGFKLYYTDVDGNTQYVNVTQDTTGVNGAYTVNKDDPIDTNPDNVTELITGFDGYIYVTGLDSDKTYFLTETTTPSGYNPLSSDIEVTIGTDGTVSYDQTTNASQVDVENKTGSELPGTGGIGTTIFYVVGGVLILGAVVLLITKKRMNKEDK